VVGPEDVHQPVHVDVPQVVQRPVLVVEEAAGAQAHLTRGELEGGRADVGPDRRDDVGIRIRRYGDRDAGGGDERTRAGDSQNLPSAHGKG
jgi:hypothetical protein